MFSLASFLPSASLSYQRQLYMFEYCTQRVPEDLLLYPRQKQNTMCNIDIDCTQRPTTLLCPSYSENAMSTIDIDCTQRVPTDLLLYPRQNQKSMCISLAQILLR